MKKIFATAAATLATGVLAATAATAAPAYAEGARHVTTAASPATTWDFTGNLYLYKKDCVDAGQEWEREGHTYQCRYGYFDPAKEDMYWLYISN